MTALGVMGVTTPAEWLTKGGVGGSIHSRRPLRPTHHVNLAAAAFGTDKPPAQIDNCRFGAVPSRHLRGIGLDLTAAIPAPDDEANVSRSGVAERHRRAGLGFHLIGSIVIGFPS